MSTHDVVIIGGGPAGLGAAATLSRARRDVLVTDAGTPRNAVAVHPFTPELEREVTERVLGARRNGLTP
ncbi:FAD-dependent oxidoreductase [Kutzneria albida]|uniref:FAD-dependent oxidoreductase n=1 Tax=Kutzneria albida TaxID=43357 RepID=UPI0004B1150A